MGRLLETAEKEVGGGCEVEEVEICVFWGWMELGCWSSQKNLRHHDVSLMFLRLREGI